jgi:hypothetical protein
MKIISFNTLYINYEKKYNPNSQILLNYPDDTKRLLDICEIILINIKKDTIICLQECSGELLSFLNDKIDSSYTIFSQEIDEDVFIVTIAHTTFSFNYEHVPKSIYETIAHGYLVITNNNMKIINCHLIPKFAAKGDMFSIIKDTSSEKKCIIAGDFNDKYKNIVKYLKGYSIPCFGSTYKTKKDYDHIIFNFDAECEIQKINTYSVSDHAAIIIDFYENI